MTALILGLWALAKWILIIFASIAGLAVVAIAVFVVSLCFAYWTDAH